jgi:26S proteasome regulatory subunit N10
MPLESCVILLDNSEWMRNGDFLPTRLSSQTEAVYQLASSKIGSNPESSVALATTARGGEVLMSLSRDIGDILSATSSIEIGGESDILSALQIAQLVLKNRKNKNGQQRIVLFVGSPVSADADAKLKRVGGQLKKAGISVDVVNFGEENANQECLETLVNAAKKPSRPSNLITIPSGSATDLSPLLIATPIFNPDSQDGAAGSSGNNAADGNGGPPMIAGVDPNADPDLYHVLMESQREFEELLQRQVAEEEKEQATPAVDDNDVKKEQEQDEDDEDGEGEEDDDEEAALALAMELSMAQEEKDEQETKREKKEEVVDAVDDDDGDDEDEDEDEEEAALALAMELSMVGGAKEQETEKKAEQEETREDDLIASIGGAGEMRDLLSSMLDSLPGVDKSDPAIRDALNSLASKKDDDNNDDKKKKDDNH